MARIFHIFPFYSIKFAGGTSDLMHKICLAQKKSGQEPIILTGNFKIDQELVAESTYQVVVFKSFFDRLGFSIMPFFFIYLIFNLSRNDIVHLHVIRTYQNLVIYLLSYFIKFKIIIDAHGAVPRHKRKKHLKYFFDLIFGNSLMKKAFAIIAESEIGVQEYLNEYPFLTKEKINILSPPFDVSGFHNLKELDKKFDLRSSFKISKSNFLITYLGRIHEIKGVDILIKFFGEFHKSYKKSTLLIIGSDDGYLNECKTLAHKLKISKNVIFAGFMSGAEKNQALKTSDCVVQLSRFEQGAWAPMEGILCETPIIVSSHTGAGEDVVRLGAGQVVPITSSTEFCKALDNIIKHPDVHKKIAIKARKHLFKHLSFEARVIEYYKVYDI